MTLRLNNDNGNSASIDYVDGATSNVDIEFPETSGTVAMVGAAGGLAGNISRANIFRLTTNFTTDGGTITGWEAPDQIGESGGIGTSVAQATGVFSFGVTGIWLVAMTARFIVVNGDTSCGVFSEQTNNAGTDWFARSTAQTGNSGTADINADATSIALLNITDTANQQLRFRTNSFSSGTSLSANTTLNHTAALFLRLGDT